MRNILAATFERTSPTPPPTPTPISASGIYWNPLLGLISCSKDGIDWMTIADKNLGATIVYNAGDNLSELNCGGYFQWGNNYMFPFTGNVTTSDTPVDTTGYGPGNYYNDSTFIIGNFDWSSVQNDNLWGDTTDTLIARQGPCSSGFHVSTKDENVALVDILTTLGIDTSNGECMQIYLKMPFAGVRFSDDAEADEQGLQACYCSSTVDDRGGIHFLYFDWVGLYPQSTNGRDRGYSVRPFKNEPVQPDSNWTVLYQPII